MGCPAQSMGGKKTCWVSSQLLSWESGPIQVWQRERTDDKTPAISTTTEVTPAEAPDD